MSELNYFFSPLADICGVGPPLFCFLEHIFLLSIGEMDFFCRNTLQNYHHRHQRSEQRKGGKNHPLLQHVRRRILPPIQRHQHHGYHPHRRHHHRQKKSSTNPPHTPTQIPPDFVIAYPKNLFVWDGGIGDVYGIYKLKVLWHQQPQDFRFIWGSAWGSTLGVTG